MSFGPSIAVSTTNPMPKQLPGAPTLNSQPTRLSLAEAQNATRHATGSGKGTAGSSSTNTGSAVNSLKHSRGNDDQVLNAAYTNENSQRPNKKPRRSTLTGAAINGEPRRGSFRKRWARTAFKGAGADMAQSPNESNQEANVSDVASEAGLVNDIPV
jgi:hypothetical protein